MMESLKDTLDPSKIEEIKSEIYGKIDDPQYKRRRNTGGKVIVTVDVTTEKNLMIEIVEDSYLAYGDDYIRYLINNQEKISDEIDKVRAVYYDDEVPKAFSNLGKILQMGMSLDATQSAILNDYSELR